MTVSLRESSGFAASESKNRWRIKVIESGWGSSGYYSPEMLATYGPNVFVAGTKVFMNHPSMAEASDRPERDVHQLAGKLVSDAVFMENGLFADVEFYSHYAPIIKEMAGDVGLSIHAMGTTTVGEADGRQGNIVESLVADPLTSVDVVTVAGAGGKFISLLESYKMNDSTVLDESLLEGNSMSITKEEFEAGLASLEATLIERLAPVEQFLSVLAESAKSVEDEEASVDAETAIDPVEVAEKFNESGLPTIALKRVAEALKSESNTKSVEELLVEEKAYAESLRESVSVKTTEVVGVVHEANKASNPTEDFDSIVGRIRGTVK